MVWFNKPAGYGLEFSYNGVGKNLSKVPNGWGIKSVYTVGCQEELLWIACN